jgi:hypothetical protein
MDICQEWTCRIWTQWYGYQENGRACPGDIAERHLENMDMEGMDHSSMNMDMSGMQGWRYAS